MFAEHVHLIFFNSCKCFWMDFVLYSEKAALYKWGIIPTLIIWIYLYTCHRQHSSFKKKNPGNCVRWGSQERHSMEYVIPSKQPASKIVGDSGGEFIQDSAKVLQSHSIQERPDGWKVANLMSLFKIGSGNTSGNYRPFSFDPFVAGGRCLKKHFRRLNRDI